MHTVILSNDLNSKGTKTDTGFTNTWITRMLCCAFIPIIVCSYLLWKIYSITCRLQKVL